ncbi:cobalt ECF transporter T component CbiQ [Polycladidibacter stylochi]|uniref:cobalt ECF transporter T component CbiQ n=1 Tax=Polycladidibacter stylochi TaxID=1807766 RepID=UPI000832F92E|nr:cobalt ECF transporter T component CbiQ [Pseudovibrio stylochi]
MGHIVTSGPQVLVNAQVSGGNRLLDKLDPRTRIITACVYAVLIVSFKSLVVLSCGLALSLAAMQVTNTPVKATLRRMLAMDGFILFTLALLPFTMPGTPIFSLFGYGFSIEGLMKAIDIALKANAIILMLMVLVGTLEPVTIGHALHRLRTPQVLVHLLMFTVRYISVLHQEYLRLRAAMKVRSFQLSNSLHTYKSVGYLVGMMLVRSLDRSERILAAMKCRGFTGTIPLLDTMQFTKRDKVFALMVLFFALLLIVMEWMIDTTY